MHVNQLNIENLTSLWKKYGSVANQQNNSTLWTSKSWPYRAWVENDTRGAEKSFTKARRVENENKSAVAAWLENTPPTHFFSHWEFEANSTTDAEFFHGKGWQLAFELTAMSLPLAALEVHDTQHSSLTFERVSRHDSLKNWLETSSEAFNYQIDPAVFQPLLDDNDVEIYLGKVNGKPAVSALLFKTGNVTGLHQMGVKSAFQGQGLAKKAMHFLINRAVQQASDYMMLQASEMGLHLYKSVGFEELFTLSHYKSTHE